MSDSARPQRRSRGRGRIPASTAPTRADAAPARRRRTASPPASPSANPTARAEVAALVVGPATLQKPERRAQGCRIPWGMPELQRLAGAHLNAVLKFERENRAYFARSLIDRGDAFYEALAEHHQAQLDEQDAGACAFYVLVDGDGSIVGRFNLYDLDDAAARVGYRVAERAAGHGAATRGVMDLCLKAARDYDLRTLTAETSVANLASQRVLEKAGFTPTGSCVVAGKPGWRFTIKLAAVST
jgi:ribosomal-protein-alanine N-acetyltransferase